MQNGHGYNGPCPRDKAHDCDHYSLCPTPGVPFGLQRGPEALVSKGPTSQLLCILSPRLNSTEI